jgi:hypothetical protein
MLKSENTFQEEYEFLNSYIPNAIEDHDFDKLPLPPSFLEDLFGDSFVEYDITQIDIEEFFNSIELPKVFTENALSKDYSENDLFNNNRPQNRFKRMIDDYGRDVFGMYLPFHYYFKSGKWGIYLFTDLIEERAIELYFQQSRMSRQFQRLTVQEMKLFYYYAVFRHEFFHHQTEAFATNAEILSNKGLYINYNEKVKELVRHTEHWLEEALAESAVLKSTLVIKRAKISKMSMKAIYEYDLQFMPPGYKDYQCRFYGGPENAHKYLASQIIQTHVEPKFLVPKNNTIKKEFKHDYGKVPVYLVKFNQKIRIQ